MKQIDFKILEPGEIFKTTLISVNLFAFFRSQTVRYEKISQQTYAKAQSVWLFGDLFHIRRSKYSCKLLDSVSWFTLCGERLSTEITSFTKFKHVLKDCLHIIQGIIFITLMKVVLRCWYLSRNVPFLDTCEVGKDLSWWQVPRNRGANLPFLVIEKSSFESYQP